MDFGLFCYSPFINYYKIYILEKTGQNCITSVQHVYWFVMTRDDRDCVYSKKRTPVCPTMCIINIKTSRYIKRCSRPLHLIDIYNYI